eukprot:70573_1
MATIQEPTIIMLWLLFLMWLKFADGIAYSTLLMHFGHHGIENQLITLLFEEKKQKEYIKDIKKEKWDENNLYVFIKRKKTYKEIKEEIKRGKETKGGKETNEVKVLEEVVKE